MLCHTIDSLNHRYIAFGVTDICVVSGARAEEHQRPIDFANNLATHNDSHEQVRETRQILLQEWLFATDGPFATHCFPHDDMEAVQLQ